MGRVIVVADDDPDILQVIEDILEDAGHVVEPTVGSETLLELEEHHPDVVLLDYQMPGMDGVQVARRIRAHPQMRDTCIVAMTAAGRAEHACRAMSANGCLPKPFDIDQLVRIVEEPDHRGHCPGG